jgi:polyhydroxyalkanoate synthase subunit PhaC
MRNLTVLSLIQALNMYWMEGAVRILEGAGRGLALPYPLHEDPPGATPYEVVYETDKLKLRHYRAQSGPRATPLLVVYALIKRPFILDLLPGRSVIENLTRQGFETFLTDWIPPTPRDRWRGFDAYVNEQLCDAVVALQLITGKDRTNMLGYCLGGLLSVLWTAFYPDSVKNLVTLATPIDTEVSENPLFNLASRITKETAELITDTYGNCPAWFINACFTAIAPVHHMLAKYMDLHKNQASRDYAEFFERFEQWMNSDVPLSGRLFSELIGDLFGRNPLVRGEFAVGNNRVDLKKITCPLLNVVGEHDDVVPAKSSLPLINLVGSRDKHNLLFRTGHVGATVSGGAHKILWPQVGAWLTERDR